MLRILRIRKKQATPLINNSMKRKLLFFFCCFTTFFSHAQQPFPLAADSAVWRTVEDYFWDPGLTQNSWIMERDSHFCGETYNVAEAFTQPSNIGGNFKVYTRNDSQKVWFRTDTNCTLPERLLYDYSLQVGDTFYRDTDPYGWPHFNSDSTWLVVDSIVPVTSLGITRRAFYMKTLPFPTVWYEGVGDIAHPFRHVLYTGTEEDLLLLCMDSIGLNIFQNPEQDSCFIVVNREQAFLEEIQVFPNPSPRGWLLKLENMNVSIENLAVYTAKGRRVYVMDPQQGQREFSIPKMEAPGVYILRVNTSQGIFQKKLIQID